MKKDNFFARKYRIARFGPTIAGRGVVTNVEKPKTPENYQVPSWLLEEGYDGRIHYDVIYDLEGNPVDVSHIQMKE